MLTVKQQRTLWDATLLVAGIEEDAWIALLAQSQAIECLPGEEARELRLAILTAREALTDLLGTTISVRQRVNAQMMARRGR